MKRTPGALCFVLPEEAWARRASGTVANNLARAHAGAAVAILSRNSRGNYTVSLRVPADARVSADAFCRQFPTGGGRRTAAGINQLPEARCDDFFRAFEQQFNATYARIVMNIILARIGGIYRVLRHTHCALC